MIRRDDRGIFLIDKRGYITQVWEGTPESTSVREAIKKLFE